MWARPVVAITLLLAVFYFAAATHSTSQCEDEVTPLGLDPVLFYLVEGPDEEIWVYQEVNGHPHLQRGGITWYAVGTGDHGIDYCWDVDLAGNWIDDPDRVVL